MPKVTLNVTARRNDAGGRRTLTVELGNPTSHVALMTHLQLRRAQSSQRVLPVFYGDNYISLAPGEKRTLTIDAALEDFKGEEALLVFDGWNTTVASERLPSGVLVEPNQDADPALQPNIDDPAHQLSTRRNEVRATPARCSATYKGDVRE